jgi:H/ACA ribonucleoprotein complex subunit 3
LKSLINKCLQCGRYTLKKDSCPYCGGRVASAHPINISLEGRHLELILMARRKRFNSEESKR